MNPNNQTQELQKLTAQLLASELTDEQNNRLVELLNESPEAVAEYVEQVQFDSLLTNTLIESVPREMVSASIGRISTKLTNTPLLRTRGFIQAAVVLFVFLVVGSLVVLKNGELQNYVNPTALEDEIAGILLDTEDVIWNHNKDFANEVEIPYGKKFPKGEILEIESGIARLRFQCGAGIVLEGPAKIELQSPLSALLHFGKLAAYVPEEAHGFTVTTADLKIVDLGTRFGAMVNASGESEVHVFEGEVDVQPLSTKAKQSNLKANETLHYSAGKVVRNGFEISPEKFADVPTREQLSAARSGVYPPKPVSIKNWKQSDIRSKGESPTQVEFSSDVIMGELFSYSAHNLHGKSGGIGFHPTAWWADRSFSRLVKPAQPMSWGQIEGGEITLQMDGRHHAYPALVHRIARQFGSPLKSEIYISFLFRYQGIDKDDFVGLWLDKSIGGKGSSHSLVPNIGIKNEKVFVRFEAGTEVYADEPVNEDVYFLVGKLFKDNSKSYNRFALWINPVSETETSPDLIASHPVKKPTESINAIGVRIGQYTEVTDKMLMSRLLIGESYESVTRPLPLSSSAINDDRSKRVER